MKKVLFFLFILAHLFSCSKKTAKKKVEVKNLFYDKAFEYLESNQQDSALMYFYKAKDLFLQRKNNFRAGKCWVHIAIIHTGKSDFYSGQESSIQALKLFDKKNKEQRSDISSAYNSLAIASFNLKEYSNSLKCYDLAIKFSDNSLNNLTYLNNKAKLYQVMKKYDVALKIYDQILKRTNNNQQQYSRTLTNISYTKWLQDPEYQPQSEFLKSLKIRERENDLWGQNSSYGHLADYYTEKRPDSALFYALKMYEIAQKIESPVDQLIALRKIISVGPLREIRRYWTIYQNLDDSLQTDRSASKNQFALIRYEVEKNKADNLLLQKDNTEKKYQIIKQRIYLSSAIIILVVGTITTIVWYRKRKQKIERETQDSIRENQLKTSKKVHDVVANGLYRLMSEIENQDDTINKDHMLDKIEYMYEKSRDISYEELDFTGENFHVKISDLVRSFATEHTKVVLVGNTEHLWKKVDAQVKYEVEHIIQELMVNMKKHSEASNVTFRFSLENNRINIYYKDNGIGISGALQYNNGLTNTGNRINAIQGEIIFDTQAEKGLKVHISFPVS